jgi:hypothetical protein
MINASGIMPTPGLYTSGNSTEHSVNRPSPPTSACTYTGGVSMIECNYTHWLHCQLAFNISPTLMTEASLQLALNQELLRRRGVNEPDGMGLACRA